MRLLHIGNILALALALAAGASWLRHEKPALSLDAAAATHIPLIQVREAEALWRESGTLFLDVRPDADYAEGHIRGALLLPYEELDERLAELQPRLQRASALVVYCKSLDCGKSLWAALALRNAGLTQVKIFPGGWNEWVLRGLPTQATAQR